MDFFHIILDLVCGRSEFRARWRSFHDEAKTRFAVTNLFRPSGGFMSIREAQQW
jgi:hypothetical protein